MINDKRLEQISEELQDLQYEQLLLESEMKNCEDSYIYNKCLSELITVRVKISVLQDVTGVQ